MSRSASRLQAALFSKRIEIGPRHVRKRGRAARRKRQHPGDVVCEFGVNARGDLASGAASRIACPFVPPKPKEFTPARGG